MARMWLECCSSLGCCPTAWSLGGRTEEGSLSGEGTENSDPRVTRADYSVRKEQPCLSSVDLASNLLAVNRFVTHTLEGIRVRKRPPAHAASASGPAPALAPRACEDRVRGSQRGVTFPRKARVLVTRPPALSSSSPLRAGPRLPSEAAAPGGWPCIPPPPALPSRCAQHSGVPPCHTWPRITQPERSMKTGVGWGDRRDAKISPRPCLPPGSRCPSW